MAITETIAKDPLAFIGNELQISTILMLLVACFVFWKLLEKGGFI